jgi:hypothetical protein
VSDPDVEAAVRTRTTYGRTGPATGDATGRRPAAPAAAGGPPGRVLRTGQPSSGRAASVRGPPGDPLTAADRTEPVGGGELHRDRVDRDGQHPARFARIAVAVRCQPRPGGDQREVDVADPVARRGHVGDHGGQQPERVGAGHLGAVDPEPAAEVAERRGAEQRVGDGVGADVGVGVPGEPGAVGQVDAAEHQRAVGIDAERVDVQAAADPGGAHDGALRDRPPGPRRARGRSAASPSSPTPTRDDDDAPASSPAATSRSTSARSSVASSAVASAAARTARGNTWGVCTPTSVLRSTVATTSPSTPPLCDPAVPCRRRSPCRCRPRRSTRGDPLEGVGDGHGRRGGEHVAADGGDGRAHHVRGRERPRRVVHRHHLDVSGRAATPARTLSVRLAPPGTHAATVTSPALAANASRCPGACTTTGGGRPAAASPAAHARAASGRRPRRAPSARGPQARAGAGGDEHDADAHHDAP